MRKNNFPYSIFVIEDNPGDILLITEYLQAKFSDVSIMVARNFKEALLSLNEGNTAFDIVLLDLTLPDAEPKKMIKEIVAHDEINCPVIILSGLADIEFSIQSISLGISDYLIKDELNAMMLYKSIIYSKERWEFKRKTLESEKKFYQLFNLSLQPMWLYDIETLRILHVNKAALQNYGFTENDFLQLDPVYLIPREKREEAKMNVPSEVDGSYNMYLTKTHLKSNGKKIEVEMYSSLLELDGKSCCSVVAIDVTEKNKAGIKFTQAIIEAQEEERYAIGSELHDNICQILTGSMLNLASVKPTIDRGHLQVLDGVIKNLQFASREIRQLSHRLAPAFFDDINLKESLLTLLTSIQVGNFETQLNFDPQLLKINFKRELQINLYRIMQEQLHNIIKYAGATFIEVNLFLLYGDLYFQIADNGKGFDDTKVNKGIGFANMERRTQLFSGTFTVKSSPNKGCILTISIPAAMLSDAVHEMDLDE